MENEMPMGNPVPNAENTPQPTPQNHPAPSAHPNPNQTSTPAPTTAPACNQNTFSNQSHVSDTGISDTGITDSDVMPGSNNADLVNGTPLESDSSSEHNTDSLKNRISEEDIEVLLEYVDSINFALYYNKYPALLRFELKNKSHSAWEGVTVLIEGAMLSPSSVILDKVGADTKVDLREKVSIDIDPMELLRLTEGVDTQFAVRICLGEEEVWRQSYPIHLMAYDQWGGMSVRPELLAAFVTPNHQMLSRITVNAARALQRLTGSSSFEAYLTGDPNQVRRQIAAIYEALRAESLVYVTAPASYEETGQRIRTVEKVLSEKLGNCIELSLLAASCLESIGINPIMVLTRGHCFVGAWLVNDSYPRPFGDQASFLLNSASDGINEVVMFEATTLTASENVTFEDAVRSTLQTLRAMDEFEGFVDVHRARICGVRPLPLRVRVDDQWVLENEGVEHQSTAGKVREYDRYDLSQYDTSNKQLTRVNIWERKLLDFSLRNTLLNMKLGKRVFQLVSFSIDKLEDYLFKGNSFKVLPFPSTKTPKTTQEGVFLSDEYPELEGQIISDLESNRICSFLGEDQLKDALKSVYRASRTSLEENGANNLYMVLGILKWYETEKNTVAHNAPLMLLPIEIVRASGGGGYVVRTRDEEMVLNITLVQYLLQTFEIDLTPLEELPKDEFGVDVKKVFAVVRDKIRNMPRWLLLEEACIGLFSFSKFVMWNDIHTNSDKLLENEIVSSLVEGRLNLKEETQDFDAKDSDQKMMPEELTIPIDVDSSQLEAVLASGAGQSFILHGPPGTGKSQTITNMIANALYQGKKVLFVAEKMAALSVVQSRLDKIGIAPFCLELHSNKVTKQHFLKQLESALNVAHTRAPSEFKKLSEELFKKRRSLIKYVEALHHKGVNGLSLYDCITTFLSIDAPSIELDYEYFKNYNPDSIREAASKIERFDTILSVIGQPKENPLYGLNLTDGSFEYERSLSKALEGIVSELDQWGRIQERLQSLFPTIPVYTTRGMLWLGSLIGLMRGVPFLSPALIRCTDNPAAMKNLSFAISQGIEAQKCRQRILEEFSESVLMLNARVLRQEYADIADKWILSKMFAKNAFVSKMKAYKGNFKFEETPYLVENLAQYQEKEKLYAKDAQELRRVFGYYAREGSEDWALMQQSIEAIERIPELVKYLASLLNVQYGEALQIFCSLIPDNYESFLSNNSDLLNQALSITNKYALWRKQITVDEGYFTPGLSYAEERDIYRRWLSGLSEFKDWYLWCRERKELTQMHLQSVIDLIVDKGVDGKTAAQAFVKRLNYAMARDMINSEDDLRFFKGVVFDQIVQEYRKITEEFKELSKKELFCKLASAIPSQTQAAHDNSEIGILKRNIKSGGRGTSIRKLIDQIPTILPRLCPCMLMSPLSVAQYIDLKKEKFDIVLFDEASQMPTSEAVGAIARGKALIVVGDPRQMPPTSFFATSSVGEEEADIDDMESILDDCISLSLPSKYLSWHYRSRHESLIAFSNTQYYEGMLRTFPSIDDRVSKVRLVKTEGIYDKGGSRSNPQEARAVVEEVIRRLRDPELSKLSIGIVSFSKVQQDKIEDMLNDELSKYPELEKLAYDSEEPIFIKNLENVQGDERDVILFSIGYGPTKEGKVSMNFGPLNNAGGERRLNVAVSRARYEMVIFSSLRSEMIDLRRTNAQGVIGLKKFLEFAERGSMSIPAGQKTAEDATVVSRMIAEALQSKGHQVQLGVGRSQFKVDVAIVDPEDPDKFILGVLLDGPGYYSTKTVRDREVVQPNVLKGLNWEVMRVWTLDWFERPEAVVKRILDKIQQKIEADRKAAEEALLKAQQKEEAKAEANNNSNTENEDQTQANSSESTIQEENTSSSYYNTPVVIPTGGESRENLDEIAAQTSNSDSRITPLVSDLSSGAPKGNEIERDDVEIAPSYRIKYEFATLPEGVSLESADGLAFHQDKLMSQIDRLIKVEQPINIGLIYKRIVKVWGLSRVSPKVKENVDAALARKNYYIQHNQRDEKVYWNTEAEARGFGRRYRSESERDILDIPLLEVVSAMRQAIDIQFAIDAESLQRITANELGFTRLGENVKKSTQEALQILQNEGYVTINGDKVSKN